MFNSWKPRAAVFAVVATMAVTVLGLASPAGAAARGNNAAARACQKGGWQTAQTSTGGAFTSEDDCVSYGAHGGTVFTPQVDVTLSCNSNAPSFVFITEVVSGFHPNSTGDGQVIVTLPFSTITLSITSLALDATGGATHLVGGAGGAGLATVTATFVDAQGVHGSSVPLQNVDLTQCKT